MVRISQSSLRRGSSAVAGEFKLCLGAGWGWVGVRGGVGGGGARRDQLRIVIVPLLVFTFAVVLKSPSWSVA